jgi:ABC-type dipeptide/oligopeptide/nickel transport system permease subunit
VGSYFGLDQKELSQALMSPSFFHIFGTDDLGRSFFWVLIRGLGNSILLSSISLGIVFIFIFVTTLVVQKSFQGRDIEIFKILEILDVIPGVIWISIVLLLYGQKLSDLGRFFFLGFLLALNHFPKTYRNIRGYLKTIYKLDYIEGGRAIGLTERQVLLRYVLPELTFLSYPMLVQTWMGIFLSEGYLSFLGVGLRTTTPTIGSLLNRGWHYYLYSPHLFLIPGFVTMLMIFLIRTKLRASLSGGPLKAQETDQ